MRDRLSLHIYFSFILRYFFEISYKGTNYHGWQIQQNALSVQQVVQEALNTLLNRSIDIVGSGRTDAGVHAKRQYFHADISEPLECSDFCYHLNAVLPEDILVKSIRMVKEDAHARFDATSRTYYYRIIKQKDPFLWNQAFIYHKELDIEKLNRASQILVGNHDFESFSKVKTQVNNFICNVHFAQWMRSEQEVLFQIKANRFLRGMVRAVVGTLLQVSEGKLDVDGISDILKSKDRRQAGRSVPAEGLFLWQIEYPDHIFKN